MDRGKIFFVGLLFLLLIVPVTASDGSLADVACSWLGLFCPDEPPAVADVFLNKQKFMVGDHMLVTAAVEDDQGVAGVKAEIEFEEGVDVIDLVLVSGDSRDGVWQGSWTVHDTLNVREYYTKIIAVDLGGQTGEGVLFWVDPTCSDPGHCASEIGGASDADRLFQEGEYVFPGSLDVGGNLDVTNIYLKKAANLLLSGGLINKNLLPYCRGDLTSDVHSNVWDSDYYNVSSLCPGVYGTSDENREGCDMVREGVKFGRFQVGTLEVREVVPGIGCVISEGECPQGYEEVGKIDAITRADKDFICYGYNNMGQANAVSWKRTYSTTSRANLKHPTCYNNGDQFAAYRVEEVPTWGYRMYIYYPSKADCTPKKCDGNICDDKCWFYKDMTLTEICDDRYDECESGHWKAAMVERVDGVNKDYAILYDCRCVHEFKYCCPIGG